MASANGYKLEVDGHELTAAWAAPYFVLCLDDADDPSEPLLIHCEDAAHALTHRRGGILLDSVFQRVSWDSLTRERIAPAGGGKVSRPEPRKCFCPGDCNCRHQGAPWHRPNYCGCKAHAV